MFDRFRTAVLRFMRVPPRPALPVGRDVRVFRAAPSYFQYHLLLWAVGQVGALAGLIAGLFGIAWALAFVEQPLVRGALHAAEAVAWLGFLLQLPFSLALVRLDFEMRWYIISDRSLRIREGIVSVKEKTMTFANIQQISIRQNPIQRILGISDVQVRTAGGGGGGDGSGESGESMHEAYFRGVDNADEIRDTIRDRVRLHRDGGLGDPDAPAPLSSGHSDAGWNVEPVLEAARGVLHEARALRRGLPARSPVPGEEDGQGPRDRM